jgi:hypothetical protein
MPQPLRPSDDQLDAIFRAAEPLHPSDRPQFLETVAELLRDQMIGDGVVSRAAREAQARLLQPPHLGHQHVSRWSSRRRNGIRAADAQRPLRRQ